MNICISTFPRSGSSFLKEYLNICTDITATKDHRVVFASTDPNTKRLMIVRRPFDSIASSVAMDKIDNDKPIDDMIINNIDRYIMFYKNIDNYDLVVSYEELVTETEKLVDKICDLVGGARNDNEYISKLKDGETNTRTKWGNSAYVVSSKGLEEYSEVVERLKAYDLSACNEAYAYAHSKAISCCGFAE